MAHSLSKTELIERLQGVIKDVELLPEDIFKNQDGRKAVKAKVSAIADHCESPEDRMQRLWTQSYNLTAIRVAISGGWFEKLASESPRTAANLAEATGTEALLVVRLMRILIALGVVADCGFEKYGATPTSKLLTVPGYRDGTKHQFDVSMPVMLAFPQYLADNHWRVPQDPKTGPFAKFWGGRNMWEFYDDEPEQAAIFNSWMTIQKSGKKDWLDAYPLEERVIADFREDADAALLVDVGGGRGHVLKGIKARCDTKSGRLVLQDVPKTVAEEAGTLTKQGIESMAYDFFTPQPIKGARAYHLRSILHDWPDDACKKILRNATSAMTKDYSKLILHERVLPATGCSIEAANIDLLMMCNLTGAERTEKQWTELLDSAGLRIEHIWVLEPGAESIIEAVLKE